MPKAIQDRVCRVEGFGIKFGFRRASRSRNLATLESVWSVVIFACFLLAAFDAAGGRRGCRVGSDLLTDGFLIASGLVFKVQGFTV